MGRPYNYCLFHCSLNTFNGISSVTRNMLGSTVSVSIYKKRMLPTKFLSVAWSKILLCNGDLSNKKITWNRIIALWVISIRFSLYYFILRNVLKWMSVALSLGVPKLNRAELETACEDFSNIITTHDGVATIYKGTLSSGVEIAVASTAIASASEWSKRAELAFRKKVSRW